MWLVLLVTILAAQAINSLVYDALFDIFNALYFSPGLQFQTGNSKYPIGWTEGNLQLSSNISCNMSMDGLKKDCHVFFMTGTVILQRNNGPGDYFRMDGCNMSVTISEVDLGKKFNLSVSSASAISCQNEVFFQYGKGHPYPIDMAWLSVIVKRKSDLFSFQYDKYVDSYPIQPLKDDAMRQIFGYVMHSKGRLKD